MNKTLIALALALGLGSQAAAATFVEYPDENNFYILKCQADEFANHKPYNVNTGTWTLRFVRIDVTPNVELSTGTIDLNNGTVVAIVNIAETPGDDADIVCYAKDKSGNESERSVDSAIVDFTPPAKGVIKSN